MTANQLEIFRKSISILKYINEKSSEVLVNYEEALNNQMSKRLDNLDDHD